jgi:hypothetical protein
MIKCGGIPKVITILGEKVKPQSVAVSVEVYK